MNHKHICNVLIFLLVFFWIFLICLPGSALSQDQDVEVERIDIPSSFNPVGSGARALGMGGAFIAIADDATAASWNPGGLIQLGRPEVSLVGAFFRRTEDNEFGTNSEASGEQSVTEKNINYFSLSYPFTLFNRNMILSLNYQHLFDFSREWRFPLVKKTASKSEINDISYTQDGNLYALGLAYCIQMTPRLSFGFTLNFWEDWLNDNGWNQTRNQTTKSIKYPENTLSIKEYASWNKFSFSGFNTNVGMLWNINDRLTMGAVLKAPFTADLKQESSSVTYSVFPKHDPVVPPPISSEDEKLDMPMSYGIGFAYRFSDKLTLSADISRTEWQDFTLETSDGKKTCPISNKSADDSDVDPTHQIRFGTEYLIFDPVKSEYVIPIRAGLFYDPAPAEGSPDDFYGFSMGSGIVMGKFVFDIAYQYRFGRDVGTYILTDKMFSQDVHEHTLYSSVIVHF